MSLTGAPCPHSKCYGMGGFIKKDEVFANTSTGNVVANCATLCNATLPSETLAEVLAAGNTTFDAANPAGNPIIGVHYTLELDTVSPLSGISPTSAPGATAGSGLHFEAESSTTNSGGAVTLQGGASTTTGDGGSIGLAAGGAATGDGGALVGASGSASIAGSSGTVEFIAGSGGATSGAGGNVSITAGSTTSLTDIVSLAGGITLTAGNNAATTAGAANGGSVASIGGSSVTGSGGAVSLTAGNITGAGVAAGSVTVESGSVAVSATGLPGAVSLVVGNNPNLAAPNANASGVIGLHALGTNSFVHIVAYAQGHAPTASTGTVTATSTDVSGQVTGATSPVVITFGGPYAVAPWVVITPVGAVPATVPIVASTVNGFTVTATGITGFNWVAIGGHA